MFRKCRGYEADPSLDCAEYVWNGGKAAAWIIFLLGGGSEEDDWVRRYRTNFLARENLDLAFSEFRISNSERDSRFLERRRTLPAGYLGGRQSSLFILAHRIHPIGEVK